MNTTAAGTKIEPFDLHVYGPSPVNKNMLRRVGNKTLGELQRAVENCLSATGLRDALDFIRPSTSSLLSKVEVPDYKRVLVIFDPGINNGHYINIAILRKDTNAYMELLTMKTFSGADKALEIHNALAKLLCA
jgi:hypothetical protein